VTTITPSNDLLILLFLYDMITIYIEREIRISISCESMSLFIIDLENMIFSLYF